MPLHRMHDRNKKWRCMEEDENIFVYREGTLDQATYNFYHFGYNRQHTDPKLQRVKTIYYMIEVLGKTV